MAHCAIRSWLLPAGQQHGAQQGDQFALQVVEFGLGGRHPDNAGCCQVHDLEGLEGKLALRLQETGERPAT